MPKQKEVATVVLAGRRFSTWETVRVELDFMDKATRSFQVSITEKLDRKAVWTALQIKPGDECQVLLAGIPVIGKGFVEQRQAAYDPQHHGVLVAGRSKANDYVDSTVERKNSQYRNKPLKEIAEKVLKPFGLSFKIENGTKSADKPFKDVSANPGETAHSFIERLARARGLFIRDDKDGNVIAATASGQAGGTKLVEGRNIKSLNCLIRDDRIFSKIAAVGQLRGDDQTNMEPSRKPAASVSGAAKRYRPLDVLAEEPGDAEDMKDRVEHERNTMLGNIIECVVTVYGWLKNGSELWDVGETVSVYSPMALLDHDLAIKTVVFLQDNAGTNTQLTLVRPEALGSNASPGITSNPNATVLPGGTTSPGTPEP